MHTVLKNFRVIDEETDMIASVIIEDGIITEVVPKGEMTGETFRTSKAKDAGAAVIIDGSRIGAGRPVLMPAFVDIHAHFRDPCITYNITSGQNGAPPSETLEAACLAAAAGGFGTVVSMANTKPPIDTVEKAALQKNRSRALGLIDLYPVLSLTKNMEGKELSEINCLSRESGGYIPPLLSEDGRDIANDKLFLFAMAEARRLGLPISCHCDFGGEEAEAAKKAGQPRKVWSRTEENNAVRRVIELGKKAGCHIHIAHVSTREAVELIRREKAELAKREISKTETASPVPGFRLSCEAMPHNFCLTEEDAKKLGEESWGRVNPPLRSEDDRKAIIEAISDGTIDAIATDHAPHREADKENGAPGFSGFETAFAAAYTELVHSSVPCINLKRLSSLMSASPARLLGLGSGPQKRGRIASGFRADLVIIDTAASWIVKPETLITGGKNSPFVARSLHGRVLLTIYSGRLVYFGINSCQ